MRKSFFGKYVFANNKIVDIEKISTRNILEDIGWMRDFKVFEVMEARKNTVFHLEDHIERLIGSMYVTLFPFLPIFSRAKDRKFFKTRDPRILSENMDFFKDSLRKAVKRVLGLNKFRKSLVWIYVTGGKTFDGFHTKDMPNLYILASKFSEPVLKKNEGNPLITCYYPRQFPRVKNTNYFAAETILTPVSDYNCEVLYCDKGFVQETSKANIFIVKNGKIITPLNNILLGVTRKIIIELARKEGLEVQEGNLSFDEDIKKADEIFITSTPKGVWPVVSIDKLRFNIGPISMKLRKLFRNYREEYYKSKTNPA